MLTISPFLVIDDNTNIKITRHRCPDGQERGGGVSRQHKRSLGDQDVPRAVVPFSGESRFRSIADLCYSFPRSLTLICLRFAGDEPQVPPLEASDPGGTRGQPPARRGGEEAERSSGGGCRQEEEEKIKA